MASPVLYLAGLLQVATRRLQVTRHFSTYASSLCHPTSSVLLAKSLILAAEKQGASVDLQALEDARARCASLLRSLARSAGLPAPRRRGWGSFLLGAGIFGAAETWQLPRCLLPVAEALYHLQRGQLLGHVVGHSDERAQLFHLFLKADLALAQAVLMPCAYQVRLKGQLPLRGDLFGVSSLIVPPVAGDVPDNCDSIPSGRPRATLPSGGLFIWVMPTFVAWLSFQTNAVFETVLGTSGWTWLSRMFVRGSLGPHLTTPLLVTPACSIVICLGVVYPSPPSGISRPYLLRRRGCCPSGRWSNRRPFLSCVGLRHVGLRAAPERISAAPRRLQAPDSAMPSMESTPPTR